jgi:hypothetical protein
MSDAPAPASSRMQPTIRPSTPADRPGTGRASDGAFDRASARQTLRPLARIRQRRRRRLGAGGVGPRAEQRERQTKRACDARKAPAKARTRTLRLSVTNTC